MKYISTRCNNTKYTFEEVFMNGLSKDGGLYIPEEIPKIELNHISELTIYELAFTIFRCYIDISEINDEDLYDIIKRSFERVPIFIKNLDNFSILELFHGPTYSFKDIALQVVGNLFEYFCRKRNKNINILGATSGDTGSAAIYGIKGKPNINCYILYPKDKVSNIQRRQMTTIDDNNIHSIEVDGNFDDCQKIVKDLFLDKEFKTNYNLSAVNSINWGRIISQIVYYFYSYFKLNKKHKDEHINFSVPTGNFGNILAGFYAKNMGLPINKLLIATNSNDILYRIIQTGIYERKEFKETITPAMDITISSNFERLLWYLIYENDKNKENVCKKVDEYMKMLQINGKFRLEERYLTSMKNIFISEKINDEEIVDTIKYVYKTYKYIADPHTAVGIKGYLKCEEKLKNDKTICIATAHPAKFEETIYKILQIKNTPDKLKELYKKQEKRTSLPIDKNCIKNFIEYITKMNKDNS